MTSNVTIQNLELQNNYKTTVKKKKTPIKLHTESTMYFVD